MRQAYDDLERRIETKAADLSRANVPLQQEGDFISAVLDTVSSLVVVLDREGKIVRFNRACEEVTHYDFDEVRGKPFWDLFLIPEEVASVKAVFSDLQVGQLPSHHENYWLTKEGDRRFIAWSNTVLSDRNGAVEYVIGTGTDLTNRKQVEELLQQQTERERLVVHIAQSIRRSLDLEEILKTTVAEVRQFLQADRVLIYRIWENGTGSTITEAVLPEWPAILGMSFPEEVFPPEYQELFRQGRVRAITDVTAEDAGLTPCLVEFVEQWAVRAKLVVSILVNDSLWGLLVAHQCASTREWQPLELDLLQQLATQMGIAIQQSELYQQTQSELSERKKAEADLKQSEQKLRAMFDSAFQFIGLLTTEGIVVAANQTALNVIAADLEDVIGQPFWMTAWWTRSPQQKQLQQAIASAANGELVRFESEHVWADGSRGFVDFSLKPLIDEEGKVVMLIPEGRDITDRKLAELAIRESNAALENAAEGISRLDRQGRYINVNKAYAEMAGYQPSELIGKDWKETVHPEDLEKLLAAYEQMLADGKVEVEARGVRKDSSIFYKQLVMIAVYDERKQLTGHHCFMKDISDRKRAEEELQRQTQRSQLFASIALKIRQSLQPEEILHTTVVEVQKLLDADRVLIFKLEADGSGVVLQEAVLPNWPTILGQTIVDPCFQQNYREWYRQGRISAIADLEKGNIQACHVEFLQQFGVKANLVVPILQRDNIWGLIITHQCRSPREWTKFEAELLQQLADQIGIALAQAELLEQETLQRQELARSNAELEQFAYVASHDLQEPLRMVTSYLQLLERRYKDNLDANANEFITYAVDGANRMQALINDLLAYSRVNRRGQPFEPVQCAAIVDRVLINLKVAIAENSALVTYDPLPEIMGDAIQLMQLFQNLIGNAIKFRSDRPPQIHIGVEGEHDKWLFSVRDNGIGFEPQYADRIFLIFQRLHNRAKYPGTGIGLAICKKIVERHGGRLWVESEPGRGSVFYFTLPQEIGD